MRILFWTMCLLTAGAILGLCAALFIDALALVPVWRAADHPTTCALLGMLVITMLTALAGAEKKE